MRNKLWYLMWTKFPKQFGQKNQTICSDSAVIFGRNGLISSWNFGIWNHQEWLRFWETKSTNRIKAVPSQTQIQ